MTEASEFMERFQKMWQAPTPDGFAGMFHPDGVFRHPSMPEPLPANQAAQYMRGVQASFPDIALEVHRWAASGDFVIVEYTLRATVDGREVAWHGADRFTLRDGRAIEGVAYFDTAALQRAVADART